MKTTRTQRLGELASRGYMTDEQLTEARQWLADLHFTDIEPEFFLEDATPLEIAFGVACNYSGGIDAFKLACVPVAQPSA